MPTEGGNGDIPDKSRGHPDKAKDIGNHKHSDQDGKYFNPYRSGIEPENKKNAQSQNSDTDTSKTDTSDPKRWTKQLVDLFDRVGNLTSADTQKLKESIEAGDRLSETQPQKSTPEKKTMQARVAESMYRNIEAYMRNLGGFR